MQHLLKPELTAITPQCRPPYTSVPIHFLKANWTQYCSN